ncbi:SPOR domain-containing protein [Cellulophaga sp. Z1A5H]|uniref:SPOR domain-containing protein n=1 Tax=Cellulophaga sp. Z1A5H TaxID=2687291 RepID=UPI0013FDF05D|nr:SPOR domain-containing protein [Cellulophaga sp. Z1A5H]
MKNIYYSAIFFLCASYMHAQDGNITIHQDAKIQKLLEIYKSTEEDSDDFQIQIYNGTLSGANNQKSNLDADFPSWKTKIDHVDTDYRVRIKDIKTALEAERKYLEVRKKYPSAIIITPK